jgi:hypothetical protein
LVGEIRYEVDVPLSIASPLVLSVEQGKTLTLEVTAKVAEGETARLSATRLPDGAEFVDHGDNTEAFSERSFPSGNTSPLPSRRWTTTGTGTKP